MDLPGLPSQEGMRVSQAQTRPCVLIVGRRESMNPLVRSALERDDLQPVWHADRPEDAFTIVSQQQPGFVVLDFDMPGSEPDVVADIVRSLAPSCWIIDFSGLVRRRPEHAHVDLDNTRPLVLVIDQPSG